MNSYCKFIDVYNGVFVLPMTGIQYYEYVAEDSETFVSKIENASTERLRAEIREIREGYAIEAIKDDEKQ